MNNKYSLKEILKQFTGWITGTVTFLTTLVGFILLFQSNLRLMVVLILLITSVAGLVIFLWILTAKTPPLIEGGKGVLKHPKLRWMSISGLLFLFVINLLFFTSAKVRNTLYVVTNINPTSLAVTPDATLVVPTPIKVTPEIKETVKVNLHPECSGGFEFLIPSDIDLNQTPQDLMEILYKKEVWKSWYLMLFKPRVSIEVTNVDTNSGTVVIANKAKIIIDSYEPLAHVNAAIFNIDDFGLPAGEACGGGGTARAFSHVGLENKSDLVSISKEYDYYTLQPGELEKFQFSFFCKQSGIYKYHIELRISRQGEESLINAGPPMTSYCPESFSLWTFDGVIDGEPHVIYHEAKYVFNESFNPTELAEGNNALYINQSSNFDWIEIMPSKPCLDAPESFLFNRSNSLNIIFNPKLDSKINVHSEPNLNSLITTQKSPGEIIHLLDGPSCANGMVWWLIEWSRDDPSGGNFVNLDGGWVTENDGVDQILLSCIGNPDCDK